MCNLSWFSAKLLIYSTNLNENCTLKPNFFTLKKKKFSSEKMVNFGYFRRFLVENKDCKFIRIFKSQRQNYKFEAWSIVLYSFYIIQLLLIILSFFTQLLLLLIHFEYFYFDMHCAKKLLNRRHISPFPEMCVIWKFWNVKQIRIGDW